MGAQVKKFIASFLAFWLAALPVFAQTAAPTVLPANTILGRLNLGAGPTEVIPFSVFLNRITLSPTQQILWNGSTSGTVTVRAQAVAGTPTILWGNTSGTVVAVASSPLSLSSTTGTISLSGAAGQVLAGATPAFTATPTLGIAGTTKGTLSLAGNTSGTVLLTPQAAAGTPTITFGTASGTVVTTATSPLSINSTTGQISLGTGIPLSSLATQATNTVVGNATSGTAVPTALAMASCSTAASAVIWTTDTGFGCNTAISAAASALTGTTLASNVVTSSLTTVGTIGTGVWQGTAVAGLYGGTGLTTAAVGDIMYASATTPTWSRLAGVATGSMLVSGGVNTAPAWSASPTLTTSLTTPLVIGGTAASSTLTLESTSGAGTTDAILFKTGSQAEAARFNTSGYLGIGTGSTVQTYFEVNGANNNAIFRGGSSTQYSSVRLQNDQNSSVRALAFGLSGSAYASAVLTNAATGEAGWLATTGAYPLYIGTNNTRAITIGTGQAVSLKGSATNDSASAGDVGEFVSSTVLIASEVSLTTSTAADVTSISLTAGDWDVWGNVSFDIAATTSNSQFMCSINTTSATMPTRPGGGAYNTRNFAAFVNGGSGEDMPCGTTRLSLSGTTTVYLVARAIFTVSTTKAYGHLAARRVR